MHHLTGYADRWSAKQGGTLRFMVSSEAGRDYKLRFVRHLCGDPNPDGPGYTEIAMPTPLDGIRAGQEQKAYLGSFAHATLALDAAKGVRLSATIWPTTPHKGEQGVVSVAIGDWMFSIGIGPGGGMMAKATGPSGEAVCVEVARRPQS
jgi:N,N-dimethylformamidase